MYEFWWLLWMDLLRTFSCLNLSRHCLSHTPRKPQWWTLYGTSTAHLIIIWDHKWKATHSPAWVTLDLHRPLKFHFWDVASFFADMFSTIACCFWDLLFVERPVSVWFSWVQYLEVILTEFSNQPKQSAGISCGLLFLTTAGKVASSTGRKLNWAPVNSAQKCPLHYRVSSTKSFATFLPIDPAKIMIFPSKPAKVERNKLTNQSP